MSPPPDRKKPRPKVRTIPSVYTGPYEQIADPARPVAKRPHVQEGRSHTTEATEEQTSQVAESQLAETKEKDDHAKDKEVRHD